LIFQKGIEIDSNLLVVSDYLRFARCCFLCSRILFLFWCIQLKNGLGYVWRRFWLKAFFANWLNFVQKATQEFIMLAKRRILELIWDFDLKVFKEKFSFFVVVEETDNHFLGIFVMNEIDLRFSLRIWLDRHVNTSGEIVCLWDGFLIIDHFRSLLPV
jgi:hypothetical protein